MPHPLSSKKIIRPLSNDEFFDAVSAASNYTDVELVKEIYHGMLRVLYSELRTKGAARFPALCDFDLILSRGKRIKSKFMKEAIIKPPFRQVRIAPVSEVRKYFEALQQ